MKFAIGSAQFGLKYGICNQSDKVNSKEIGKILAMAADKGIDTIDTAISYGESETILGETGVTDWKIVSKLPEIPSDCLNVKEWIYKQTEESLRRLKIN